MGRKKREMLSIHELDQNAVAVEATAEKSLYWFGMLPAPQPFKWPKQTRQIDPVTNDYYTLVDVTSQELWEGPINQWRGKCPWLQSISVNGLTFPAFSQRRERVIGGGEADTQLTPWPGSVGAFDDEKAAHIIQQCYRNVMRLHAPNKAKEICLDQPASYAMNPVNGSEVSSKERFNPKTDTYVAHYVYFMKMDADPNEKDPSDYWHLALPWDEFFNSGLKSVFEMYPLQDLKKPDNAGK